MLFRILLLQLLIFATVSGTLSGQTTRSAQISLQGIVIDEQTGKALQGATVILGAADPSVGADRKTGTDEAGRFGFVIASSDIPTDSAFHITVRALGYAEARLTWRLGAPYPEIFLEWTDQRLEEVLVSVRSRYRNRNNPAVELIQQVIANRSRNSAAALPDWQYHAYEKIVMAASDIPEFFSRNPLFRNYDFIFENTDTLLSPGRKLLPLYIEERMTKEYRRHQTVIGRRTEVEALRKTELDKRFVNNENIQSLVSYLHGEIDLYANDLLLFNRAFLSPVATGAPLFYKYFIRDTVRYGEDEFIWLDFEPRNPEDRLFSGYLLITRDGRYAVRSGSLQLDLRSNINWINDLSLRFDYEKHPSGMYMPARMEAKVNFGIYGTRQGMFSHWLQQYSGHRLDPVAPGVFLGQPEIELAGARERTATYWDRERPVALSAVEATTYRNVDSLQRNRSFKKTLEWLSVLITSYKHLGAVDIGPLEYMYSFNDLEGNRFRISGRTSDKLSRRFYGDAYLAYGTRDRQWKYYGRAALSLHDRRVAEYPAHYLQFTYQHDAREPGQLLDFRNGDSFFHSFRKSDQDKWLYHTVATLSHVVEFGNHWRLQTSVKSHLQEAAAYLVFRQTGDGSLRPGIRTTEAAIDLRWAPNEQYFQRNMVRKPIGNKYPVFNLRYNAGIRGLLGGEYEYHALRFDIHKRWYLSQLGFSDIRAGTGYIFGRVPFPLLDIPMANQSFLLAADSYSLMNDLEFVSDQFVKFSVEHRFQGFFFNKIPLLKKMKIRELIGAKLFYGGLRNENNPLKNPELFYFPVDREGMQTTFSFDDRPYVEVKAGLENIFNVFQIEYVKRLSYLEHPNLRKGGLRFGLRISF